MIGEHLVNEKTLTTFLTEVEKILNGRPITRVSSDPGDSEALNPNHILLSRQNPRLAPCELEDSDKFQARWKHVHILSNEFRARWLKNTFPCYRNAKVVEIEAKLQSWRLCHYEGYKPSPRPVV